MTTINEEYESLMKVTKEFIQGVITKKYLLNDEKTYEDIINCRFLPTLAKTSLDKTKLNYIIEMFLNKRCIPAGSILSGLGNAEYTCSLSNCYYTPIQNDSLEAIFECEKQMARTFSWRGGSGTSISVLRPKDAPVKNAARTSSGSISFMPRLSLLAHDIGQSGRRGAILIDIDCRHPDLLDFIWCKANPDKVFEKDYMTGYQPTIDFANISVQVTNKFMEAVKTDSDWDLFFPVTTFEKYDKEWTGNYDDWISKGYPVKIYKTVKAKDILKLIAEASWLSGDPGIIFRDNLRDYSSCAFDPKLIPVGCNPCAEQALNSYGNCLLAAIVLHKYVKNSYEPTAEFDMYTFLADTEHLMYFMDKMIDLNNHPLPEQNETDQYSRRIGIEITALHDLLAMMNMDYGSDEACEFIDDIMYSKTVCEIKTSIKMAKSKGYAPCFKTKKSRKAFIDQPYIQRILKNLLKTNQTEIINNIMEYGLRGAAFNTIGPTGSISIVGDNCTSGIEPIYNISYYRKSRLFGDKQIKMVHLPLIKHVGPKILSLTDEEIKKKYHYKCAHDIDYITRIKVQSTIQKWTDNSISSTINLNNDATIDDIFNIYLEAYDKQLKGITVFRDGSKKGVLSSEIEGPDKLKDKDSGRVTADHITTHLTNVKDELNQTHRAYRYIRMWKGNKVYITITIDKEGKPIEIFANVPYEAGVDKSGVYHQEQLMEKKTYWDTICRLISLMLRLNAPIPIILKQLDKSSPNMVEMPSIIAHILRNYIEYTPEKIEEIKETKTGGEYCQSCGEFAGIYQGGCLVCQGCGDSKCG